MRAQSCLTLCTPCTVAHHAPLSTGFSRQEYWSWLPYPPSGDLSNPQIKLSSLASPALAGEFFTTAPPWNISHIQKKINKLKDTFEEITYNEV